MRVTADIFVRALMRRAEGEGAFAHVARRGAHEAGAIHVLVDDLSGNLSLYGPAIGGWDRDEADGMDDRRFTLLRETADRADIAAWLERETRFDADLWLIEVEDRQGRSFLDPETLIEE